MSAIVRDNWGFLIKVLQYDKYKLLSKLIRRTFSVSIYRISIVSSMLSFQTGIINAEAFDKAFDEWCYLNYEMESLLENDSFVCPACHGQQHAAHCDGNAKLVRFKSGGM